VTSPDPPTSEPGSRDLQAVDEPPAPPYLPGDGASTVDSTLDDRNNGRHQPPVGSMPVVDTLVSTGEALTPSDTVAESETSPATGGRQRRRHDRRRSRQRNLIEWAIVVVGALLVAFLVKTFLVQAFYIPSQSMEPTLNIGDRVLVNKLSYDIHDVNRGDIIVFERPPSAGPGDVEDLIKRVVALPGETVEARDGQVFVDEAALDEPYLPEGVTTPDFDAVDVPADHVFVLGDNRGNSQASNAFGPIHEDLIIGRAFVRVWPVTDLGGL
jgi:signal peptidase I